MKKRVTKKPAKKKNIVRKAAPKDEPFWVNNGPIVKTIPALIRALKEMSDFQFNYHTVRGGNDFANWVSGSLNNKKCATKIRRIKNKEKMAEALKKCK